MSSQAHNHAAAFDALSTSEFFNLHWDAAHEALFVSLRGDLSATLNQQALVALLVLFGQIDRQGKVRHIVFRSESADVFGGALDVDEIDLLVGAVTAEPVREYAQTYANVIHWIASAPERGIHPIALVRGNALGALGFVLPCSTLVVEEGARMSKMPLIYCPIPSVCAQSYPANQCDPVNIPATLSHEAIFDAQTLVSNSVRARIAPCGGGDAAVKALLAEIQPRLPGFLSALRARLLLSHRVSLEGLHIEAADWANRVRPLIVDSSVIQDPQSQVADWHDCEAIADHPEVDEAIRALLDDQTGDNAVAMIQAVLGQAEQTGILQRPLWYRDSTPNLHVGGSSFESWYAEHYAGAGKGEKQKARDAYAAGMGDPLVVEASLAADLHTLTPAARDVLLERQRQQELGYSLAHDDAHGFEELAAAGACYGLGTGSVQFSRNGSIHSESAWPHGWEFKSEISRRDQLVKFVALGLAALEAHDRAAADGLPAPTQDLAA